MLSDITSDQHDSTQCRHCGVTLATCLVSCPSCGANQLDPLGWYSPSLSSASARLPPPPSSIAPQLAAPAVWNTPAGVEDDRFHAKYDPWLAPKRSPFVWVIAGLVVVFLMAAVAGYVALRPASPVSSVMPKAVSGSVTAQQAVPRAAIPAPSSASSVVATPSAPAPLAAKSVPSAPLAAKPAAPEAVVQKPAPQLANSQLSAGPARSVQAPVSPAPVVQNQPAHVATAQSSAAPSAAVQSSVAPRPIAQTPPVSKPSTPTVATVPKPSTVVPKPAQTTLAAVPRPATSLPPDTRRDTVAKTNVNGNGNGGKPDEAHPEVAKNLQIARAMLQKDNLTAAEPRLSAVLAAQPKNREALDMRADLTGREQRRDAALDVAHGCVYMGRWNCAWHNAGSALVIDSGSADAKNIIAQAMNEAQPPARARAAPPIVGPHDPPDHH
jgi:hypothetical protein